MSKSTTLIETNLTENAERVLQARYLRKNEKGEFLESPQELFIRVAQAISAVETKYGTDPAEIEEVSRKFYEIMAKGHFMPNSPTLMNAGREMGMLSACFVLPLEDSIDDIFSTVKATAMIQKAGGGTGFSFDKLRPNGDYIHSSGGTTSGPISFWKVLSEATNAIQQGAFRRGANMGMMSITHPDIITFIYAKQDLSAFTNFNISIKVTNEWMEAYKAAPDDAHIVTNFRTDVQYVLPKSIVPGEYDISKLISLEDYQNKPEAERVEVWTRREVFAVIVDCAWRTGEPGLIFIDNINKANPTPHIGEIEATNPCGEQPLLPYEACNLGSINVAHFVQKIDGEISYDWEALKECVHISTRFLDNVIEANRYPLTEIEEMCYQNRKIGLGIMGFADALFKLEIPYNSEAGVEFGAKVMKCINDEAHNASEELAKVRGNFPSWEGSIWDTKHQRPMRNSAATTVAPTGTISIIANCSGGIEPLFSLAFVRQVLDGQKLVEINPYFEKIAKDRGFYSQELMERIAEEGSIAHIDSIPQDIRDIFVCSHDIAPIWHVRMQGAFQKHCDSSISKTINLPHDADRALVEEVYMQAWDLNCKGITVYRDGCRTMQPMTLTKKEKPAEASLPVKRNPEDFVPRKPMRTPNILSAVRIRQATPFGHMHVTLTVDPMHNRELEVFAQLGKAGDVAASDLEAISRLTSLYLRLGGSISDIIDQLEGIGSHMSVPTRDGRVMSLADALGKTLHKYKIAKDMYGLDEILMGKVDFSTVSLKDDGSNGAQVLTLSTPSNADSQQAAYKVKCPECEGILTFTEGCIMCHSCGYSKC
ncbi:MAG: vitamin B12-dependent ribonucleotide reductase [Fibrobacter sp.]|nr:vitamin B12-dependent ribonucleotide reductase [Fibrobacter sp.]